MKFNKEKVLVPDLVVRLVLNFTPWGGRRFGQ